MRKFGILVNNLGPNQLAFYIINRCNQLRDNYDICPYVFYENMAKPCLVCRFPVMQIAEAWGFEAPCIATTYSTAQKLIQLPAASSKAFYVWDLEWVRFKEKQFEELKKTYGSNEVTLWARSQYHARYIKTAWNKSPLIVPNLNLDTLISWAK